MHVKWETTLLHHHRLSCTNNVGIIQIIRPMVVARLPESGFKPPSALQRHWLMPYCSWPCYASRIQSLYSNLTAMLLFCCLFCSVDGAKQLTNFWEESHLVVKLELRWFLWTGFAILTGSDARLRLTPPESIPNWRRRHDENFGRHDENFDLVFDQIGYLELTHWI